MPAAICRWMRERKRRWRWRPFLIAVTAGSLFILAKSCPGKLHFGRSFRLSGFRRFGSSGFFAAIARAAHAVAIAAGTVIAPAPRVGFGPVVEYPLTSFIRAILQAVRTFERKHFREGGGDAGKYPGPAGTQWNKFGVHSILALEQLYAHRYAQIRIK